MALGDVRQLGLQVSEMVHTPETAADFFSWGAEDGDF